jgi:Flp pilus assembly protein TadG
MRNRLHEFLRSKRATAAIEFAIIAPVMVIMAAGTSEVGRYFVVYDAVNRLATQYASAWADCSDVPTGTCATELSTFASAQAIANIAPRLTPSKTTLSMFQVTMSGSTPTIVSSYPSGASLSSTQIAAATSTFTSGQSGVVVTVSYNHTLDYFPSVMTPSLGSILSFSFTIAQLKS